MSSLETICIECQILFSGKNIVDLSSAEFAQRGIKSNPSPAEPGYTLPLQTASVDPGQLASEEAN